MGRKYFFQRIQKQHMNNLKSKSKCLKKEKTRQNDGWKSGRNKKMKNVLLLCVDVRVINCSFTDGKVSKLSEEERKQFVV